MKKYYVLMKRRIGDEPTLVKECKNEAQATLIVNRVYKKTGAIVVAGVCHNARAQFSCDRINVFYKRQSLCSHPSLQLNWSFDSSNWQETIDKCVKCGKEVVNVAVSEVMGDEKE